MTQQFNLPPGLVEAAARMHYEQTPRSQSLPFVCWPDTNEAHRQHMRDLMSLALQAALEWAVKEGWAKSAFAIDAGCMGWLADTFKDGGKKEFPALILRLEEPKP